MTRLIQKRMLEHKAVMWDPKKSVVRHNLKLCISKTTVQNLSYTRLRVYAYRIQLQHGINDTKPPNRVKYANVTLNESAFPRLE
jgi:hypothetical protein